MESVVWYLVSFNERIFNDKPKFIHRFFLNKEMWIFSFENSPTFCANAKVEKWNCLLIARMPRLVTTENANFVNLLHLQPLISVFLSRSVACVWFSTGSTYTGSIGYVTLGDGSFRRTLIWIAPSVEFASRTSSWVCQQGEFLFSGPFFPRKRWCDCGFLPESVYKMRSFFGRGLRHFVLLNLVLIRLRCFSLSFSQIRQLRRDWHFLMIDFGVYFQIRKFAAWMASWTSEGLSKIKWLSLFKIDFEQLKWDNERKFTN